jgi:hypothetical protein
MTPTDDRIPSIDKQQPPVKEHRFWMYTGRVVLLIIAWAFLAGAFGFPSPLDLVLGAASLVKQGTDLIYYAFNEDELRQSSEKATGEAVENDTTGQAEGERSAVRNMMKLLTRSGVQVRPVSDSVLKRDLKELSTLPPVGGRVINILLFGVDARMGTLGARADAIHLFTINPDSGIVDIMSIPRGTIYDCGFPDTSTANIISSMRGKGIERFLKAVEEITNRRPIRYYVEVGFSQALGVLELLGYKDPKGTLRFLRSRKTFRTGDFQRSHNQSVFLRHSLVDKFSLFTGATGEVLLTAGLRFVNTNLTKDFCRGLIYALQSKGFPKNRSDASRVKMLPGFKMNLLDLLPDSANVAQASRASDNIVGDQKAVGQNIAPRLQERIRTARADTLRPARVIRALKVIVGQHIWLQIDDRQLRRKLRDEAIDLLINAYIRQGNNAEVDQLRQLREAEDQMLGNQTY